MVIAWNLLEKSLQPQQLTNARLQLHYAVQLIAATGAALGTPLPDGSHTSFTWEPNHAVFLGSLIQTVQPFSVAIAPHDLTLSLLDQNQTEIARFPLHQQTLASALDWLKQAIAQRGADPSAIAFLDYPPDDFPDHPLAHGATFDPSLAIACRQLADYYANTYPLLSAIVATYTGADDLHIWPHHFDMATLITLPGTQNKNPLTIGVGLSPGDTSYNEPYWYVSPYPYPDTDHLPRLANGFWHTQHWVGAVLTASQVMTQLSLEQQQLQVKTFLDAALQAAIALLIPEAI